MTGFYSKTADGKKVSRIFLGTAGSVYSSGGEQNALLDKMFSAGITAFDTARVYSGAEECLGKWISSRNNREQIFVLTKCGHPDKDWHKRVNERDIRADLDLSLKNLRIDYADSLLLHRDDESVPVGEIIGIFNDLKREGKILSFGVSNWSHKRIAAANDYARAHNLEPFTISSPYFGLGELVTDPWGDCVTVTGKSALAAREWYKSTQMPLLAYSALGHGFFSGRLKSGERNTEVLDETARVAFSCEANFARLRRCEELALKKEVTVAQIALSWIFRRGMNVFAIVGSSDAERMKSSIAAFYLDLSESECDYLNDGLK